MQITLQICSTRELLPLQFLRRLHRLTVLYGCGSGIEPFLDDSLFEALGSTARGLKHLELPVQAVLRPEYMAKACASLESLVGHCFFRRPSFFREEEPLSSAAPAPQLRFLRVVEVETLIDASILLPLCPYLRSLSLTMAQMGPTEAAEIADLCVNNCPELEIITLRLLYAGCSHGAAVSLFRRCASVPKIRVFCADTSDFVYGC